MFIAYHPYENPEQFKTIEEARTWLKEYLEEEGADEGYDPYIYEQCWIAEIKERVGFEVTDERKDHMCSIDKERLCIEECYDDLNDGLPCPDADPWEHNKDFEKIGYIIFTPAETVEEDKPS